MKPVIQIHANTTTVSSVLTPVKLNEFKLLSTLEPLEVGFFDSTEVCCCFDEASADVAAALLFLLGDLTLRLLRFASVVEVMVLIYLKYFQSTCEF